MSANIKHSINFVLENYINSDKRSTFEYISKNIPEFLNTNLDLKSKDYSVKGSNGNGNKTDLPWIGIFNNKISKTAQEGYDIVFLFRYDMSGFYLSLNQGWTYYQKKYGNIIGLDKIKIVTDYWKSNLASNGFSTDPILLNCTNPKNKYFKGYEAGNIFSKFYYTSPDEMDLLEDLKEILVIYHNLFKKLNGKHFSQFNDMILLETDAGMIKTSAENSKIEIIEENLVLYKHDSILTLVSENVVNTKHNSKQITSNKKKEGKINPNSKLNKLIGFAGELMVFKYESDFLKKNEVGKEVEHTSLKNDFANYDVLSYDELERKKYIEVKTTSGNLNQDFYISNAELKYLESTPNSYIYRVYNFDINTGTGDLRIFDFKSLEKFWSIEPINYRIKLK